MALPISTPFNGMEEARMLPKVLPPATSLWFTKRWHGTLAASQMLAKMAADPVTIRKDRRSKDLINKQHWMAASE